MKNICIIILSIFLFLFIGCSSSQTKGYPKSANIVFNKTRDLNKLIDKSQKESLVNSPFEGKSFLKSYLKIQKPFREQYIQELENLRTKSPNDTIILVESYDEICINCRADHIAIYKDNLLITYRKISYKEKYKRKQEYLTSDFIDKEDYRHDDILELKLEIKQNNSTWNRNPEKYGTDEVLGGSYTFYSVIYPDRRVESMYIRGWMSKESRKK